MELFLESVQFPLISTKPPVSTYISIFNDDTEIDILTTISHLKKETQPNSLAFYKDTVERWLLYPSVFRENFRMSPSTIEILISIMGTELNNNFGRPQVETKRQVLLGVWILVTPESFRGVSHRFGMERGCTYRVFVRFIEGLYKLRHKFVKWPPGLIDSAEGFKTFRKIAFPGAAAALDGCHIPIKAPVEDKSSYFNRKHHYSVNLQCICDSRKVFVDVFAGWPGSSHDARVWRQSKIFKFFRNNPLRPDLHILADSAYPLTSQVLVPFKDNGQLTPQQRYYNRILSSSRCIIEQAYGLLMGRFRRLKYLDMSNMNLIPKVIVCACILHNICILQNDITNDEAFWADPPEEEILEAQSTNAEGSNKRRSICQELWNLRTLGV